MKNSLFIFITFISASVFAQTTLLNEDFSNGIPSTWSTIDGDQNAPTGLAEYTDAWIGYTSVFDTCAASTSYYLDANGDEDTAATSADYLITPKISLLTFGNLLTWDAKSLDGSFPDGYIVLVSTTDSLEASFTDTIKIVSAESQYWTSYTINLMTEGYANQDVFIAFKNTTKDGYVLQIDNVKITGDDPASISTETSSLSDEIQIFPNPAIDIITIQTSDFLNATIYSVNGTVLMNSTQNKMNVSELPKGIYFILVQTSIGTIRKTIIKA